MNRYNGLLIATGFILAVVLGYFIYWLLPENVEVEEPLQTIETVFSEAVMFKVNYDEYGRAIINNNQLLCTIRNFNDVGCSVYLEKDDIALTHEENIKPYGSCYVLSLVENFDAVGMRSCNIVYKIDNGSTVKCAYTILVNKE